MDYTIKYYLTDLFLNHGYLIPLAIVKSELKENNLRLSIKTCLFNSTYNEYPSDSVIQFLPTDNLFSELRDGDIENIGKYFAKQMISELLSEESDISFYKDFKLQECSLSKLFILTGARLNKNKLGNFIYMFSSIAEAHQEICNLLKTTDNDSMKNNWYIRSCNQ